MTNRQKTILVGLALVAIIVFVVLGFLVFSRDVARDVKAVAFVATDIKPTASATTTDGSRCYRRNRPQRRSTDGLAGLS